MWKPIPEPDRCNHLAPDGVSRCLGPRGHHGYHGSNDHIWHGETQERLGNRREPREERK